MRCGWHAFLFGLDFHLKLKRPWKFLNYHICNIVCILINMAHRDKGDRLVWISLQFKLYLQDAKLEITKNIQHHMEERAENTSFAFFTQLVGSRGAASFLKCYFPLKKKNAKLPSSLLVFLPSNKVWHFIKHQLLKLWNGLQQLFYFRNAMRVCQNEQGQALALWISWIWSTTVTANKYWMPMKCEALCCMCYTY